MTKAVLYGRYSPRPRAEECDSVAKQLERCRAYCVAHGYEVLRAWHDDDLSGGRADNRPGLQAALTDACKARGVLVVYSLDRLARNTRDAIDILDQLRKAKADLASLTESLNTKSAIGEFLFELLSSFAKLQRQQIVERTRTTMRHYQTNGRRMTRLDRCPYGKMPDEAGPKVEKFNEHTGELLSSLPAQMVDCPEEQAAIALVCQLRSEGLGARRITKRLNDNGVPCRGKRWHQRTVEKLIERHCRPKEE